VTWDALADLPLEIESYDVERLSAPMSYGMERVTSLVHLRGAGEEGLGEDVSVSPLSDDESGTLHAMGPVLPVAGSYTLGSFCEHMHGIEQWRTPPEWEPMRRWRNWAFQSAALDLALRQAGMALHDAIGREPRPIRFVNSLGLGTPPTFDPIARRLDAHPGLRFKLDVTHEWTSELIERVAATGAVDIVDFKGRYQLELGSPEAMVAMYERTIVAFPDALLEDGHEVPELVALLEPQVGRLSYDAPIHSKEDLETLPLPPNALNIKPCRVGDLPTLFELYAECDARGLVMYGGGMGELSVGRGQIQLLASLFHPDGPNDTAPGGYNTDAPAADLPPSPLEPRPAAAGFRREL
jgi:hypothetical protein